MEVPALYLLKVHVGISLFFGAYYLTVKNEAFFKVNRFILLAILFLSFTMPLLANISIDEMATCPFQKMLHVTLRSQVN